jgi:[lysine-biosynthesis-protein LysW]--L-2-aminoadipate ligase
VTASSGQVLAVLASRIRLEEKLLLAELDRRRVRYQVLDTRSIVFRPGEALPYHGALIREISHTRGCYAARLLEHAGVPAVNSSQVISLCGDKLLTSLALQKAGLPVPRFLATLTPGAMLPALDELGYPAVVKPVIGSWGRLAARLTDADGAQAVLEHRAALPGPQNQVTYAQEYVDKPDRDIKAYVLDGQVVGAIYKTSAHWRTNTARGGRPLVCPVDDDLAALLAAAANAVGDGLLGIDVLEDRSGARYVNEINHTPEFHGAIEVLHVDLVGRYVDYALSRLGWS